MHHSQLQWCARQAPPKTDVLQQTHNHHHARHSGCSRLLSPPLSRCVWLCPSTAHTPATTISLLAPSAPTPSALAALLSRITAERLQESNLVCP
jgi:hypothetical protein